MDKYKALREKIVKKIVVDTAIPKDTVNLIIDYQSRTLVKAFTTPKILTVEISGFGTFRFSEALIKRHVRKMLLMKKNGRVELEKEGLTKKRCNFLVNMTGRVDGEIEMLINKVGDELGADLRRMEEQANSPQEA